MKNFSLLFPKKIFFGYGSLQKLKDIEISGDNGLLITGKNFAKKTGLLDKIVKIIKKRNKKIFFFNEVEPEVSVETVDNAVAFAKEKKIDFIIGAGGGSALDCAKAVSGILNKNFSVKDYLDGKVKIDKKSTFFIAIPTTAGTGSEVTKNAVLNYTEKNIKISLRSEKLVPDVVIADPKLTLTMPPSITAFTGMDALCHAVESYFSTGSNDFTRYLSEKAIKLIFENLYPAYINGNNKIARCNMLYASLLAGLSFANAGLGAVHGISHPAGAVLKIPHGLANAILLPYVLEFNKIAIKKELINLEKKLKCKLINRIRTLNKKLNISSSFSKLNKNFKNKIDTIISKMEYKSGSMSYNPVKMDKEKVKFILKKVF